MAQILPPLTVVGFDSAWTDSPKAPGAVCAIRLNGPASFGAPSLASFDQALDFICAEQATADSPS
jgi:predicted RNase H-like nuclease